VIIEWLERVTHRKFTNRFTNREFNTSKSLDTPKIHQSRLIERKLLGAKEVVRQLLAVTILFLLFRFKALIKGTTPIRP
jgi:hypothetical protein